MNALLRIELAGFWHAGSGRGEGLGADLLVTRTAGGLPYLPGRTLKGLLREAVREACELEVLSAGRVETLFGGRAEHAAEEAAGKGEGRFQVVAGTLRVSDARLGEDPEARQAWEAWAADEENRPTRDQLTRILASTAIDEKGLARDKTLRCMEVAVPMRLFAIVEGEEGAGDWRADLKAALPLLRGLGHKRSRGFGRCRVELVE
ncbi:MAG TPA: RAMP superfamily CRISPR-associated protein [Myxococcota bacterium]|nr:RAMP superfamily CRISPR-associated protein [Myxococcota bacterium]HRY96633.1 RAMP superfamily CRISPR-associated protein [Myxococcota bacterium]